MKIGKSIVCLLCAAALLLSLTGCASLSGYLAKSKEDVLLQLTQYIDNREATSADVAMDITVTSRKDGAPTCIAVSLDSRVLMASETESYAEGEFTYTVNDTEVNDSAQVYNFAENGKLLTFTHMDSSDRWFRSESTPPESLPTPAPTPAPVTAEGETELTIPAEYAFLLLEEGTQTIDGASVYLLTGTVEGADCLTFLQDSSILGALTARLHSTSQKSTDLTAVDLKGLDFSALSAEVAVAVETSSGAPAQIEMTLSGMNLLIADLLGLLPQQATAFLGSAVTVEPIRIVVSDIGFDPVTIPEMTEEARVLAMQESLDPDRGDGTYILQQQGDSIRITAQKGWTVSELGFCFAGFHNANRSRSAFYELYRNTTAEEFIALVEDGMIPAIEAHELTVTTAYGEPIGEYQTYCIKADAVNVYLAYRTVGNSLLGIYAEDSSGAGLTSVLTPILDAVEDYQIEY